MSLRRALKRVVEGAALARVAPLLVACGLGRRLGALAGKAVYVSAVQRASKWPGPGGILLRRAFYRRALRSCGTDCTVAFGTFFSTSEISLGDSVYIGAYGNIGHCSIGSDTLLGSNVTILAGGKQHGIDRLDIPVRLQPGEFREVSIGRDVWIGNGAIVAADVGDHAVVAAGAIVVKPVAAYAIVGGNPARQIGDRRERAGLAAPEAAAPGAAAPGAAAPVAAAR